MKIANYITIGIVCCAWLASPVAGAGEEMSREPRQGEKIEPTKIGDDKTTRLLVGTWKHEYKLVDAYEVKQTYTFEKDGSYSCKRNRVSRLHGREESNVKGQWTVRDGILTLTPTDPKGEEGSLYGRFTAYTIMKISDTTIEWQINYGRSDTSESVKRTLEITTHKRVSKQDVAGPETGNTKIEVQGDGKAPATGELKDVPVQPIPDKPAAGKVHGKEFKVEKATLEEDCLKLRQGEGFSSPFEEFEIDFRGKNGGNYAGKTFTVQPNQKAGIDITLAYSGERKGSIKTRTYTNSYTMKLEFGTAKDGKIPGKIHLRLPDEAGSFVVGTFEAEIK